MVTKLFLALLAVIAYQALPSRDPRPAPGATVVWQLVYVSPSGDAYVRDTLANIGDCWQAIRTSADRRGLSCERTRIVPR